MASHLVPLRLLALVVSTYAVDPRLAHGQSSSAIVVGRGTIPEGQHNVGVLNDAVTSESTVFLTVDASTFTDSDVRLPGVKLNNSGIGFFTVTTLDLRKAPHGGVPFNYMIVRSKQIGDFKVGTARMRHNQPNIGVNDSAVTKDSAIILTVNASKIAADTALPGLKVNNHGQGFFTVTTLDLSNAPSSFEFNYLIANDPARFVAGHADIPANQPNIGVSHGGVVPASVVFLTVDATRFTKDVKLPGIKVNNHGAAFFTVTTLGLNDTPRTGVPFSWVLLRLPQVSEFQPAIARGGRIEAVDVSPSDKRVMIAASSSGGLFLRRAETGDIWRHVEGLSAFRMSDVRFAPGDSRIALATSWGDTSLPDGNGLTGGGIWRSTDGGSTWQKPRGADPANCADGSAWGIAFEGRGSKTVYVGTDCGVAVSDDLGATWRQPIDPATSTSIPNVNPQLSPFYSLTATSPGRVHACGRAGYFRSNDSGRNWSRSASFPGACSGRDLQSLPRAGFGGGNHQIAFFPGRSDIVIAAMPNGGDATIYESDDSGVGWTAVSEKLPSVTHAPWVRIRPTLTARGEVEVYASSNLDMYRQRCSPSRAGEKCKSTGWSKLPVDHADQHDAAFAPDGCALAVASDGGIHYSAGCGDKWENTAGAANGLDALQIYQVTGERHRDHTDLYIGTQDNSVWASGDSGATWPHSTCSEGFAMELPPWGRGDADDDTIAYTCCGPPCSNTKSSAHFDNGPQPWHDPERQFLSDNRFAWDSPLLVRRGVYLQFADLGTQPTGSNITLCKTSDGGNSWSKVITLQRNFLGEPHLAGSSSNPVLYYAITRSDKTNGLLKITDALSNGTRTTLPEKQPNAVPLKSLGTFCHGDGFRCPTSAFGVNPHDPNHLIAADEGASAMKQSHDGGVTWTTDNQLTNLVTAGGRLRFIGALGVAVHAIAFDPHDRNNILVGTEAAGVMMSRDGGQSWKAIPGSERLPAISSFFFDTLNQYVVTASFGRGLWRLYLD